jgi:hypothetical protein
MTFAVECKYRHRDKPDIIAVFGEESCANDYARMHNGEGGCILSVAKSGCGKPLEYEIRTIYSYGSVSYPTGISFQFECEANSFAYRKARWKGGYLVVVHQPLSEADVRSPNATLNATD